MKGANIGKKAATKVINHWITAFMGITLIIKLLALVSNPIIPKMKAKILVRIENSLFGKPWIIFLPRFFIRYHKLFGS